MSPNLEESTGLAYLRVVEGGLPRLAVGFAFPHRVSMPFSVSRVLGSFSVS